MLAGFDAPYVPGWDCHGLPIELQVEKKRGKVGDKLSAKEFRAACREYAMAQVDSQREDFKSPSTPRRLKSARCLSTWVMAYSRQAWRNSPALTLWPGLPTFFSTCSSIGSP